jgi:beta-mannosidase
VSQVLQAEGIRIGAEHLRRIMPHNMGSLYWQIDDCWPVASWSSIDYYGRWKALQYYARRFYSDLLISPTVQNDYLKLFVVSDRPKAVAAKIRVTLMNLDGTSVKSFVRDVNVEPLASRSYFDLRVSELLGGNDEKRVLFYCELLVNDKIVSSHDSFFVPFKELTLSKPNITSEVVRTKGGFSVKLASDKFAKAVYLAVPEHDGFFSDNYFNLAPGREMTVEYRSRVPLSLEQFRERLQVRSIADAF